MRYTLLRHATGLLDFGGQHVLIDPMLDDQGARPPIANTPNPRSNPLVPLPETWREIVADASAHLVTHMHQDHFDSTAARTLSHSLPVICQPEDCQRLEEAGFHRLEPVETFIDHHGVNITRTGGQHGVGELGRMLAPVSGFVLEHPNEPVTYVTGDTVWCQEVADALERFQPAVIVANAGGARFLEGEPIVMTAADLAAVAAAAPRSQIVVVHLEAINHCLESRDYYASKLPELGVDMARIHLPANGEGLTFT